MSNAESAQLPATKPPEEPKALTPAEKQRQRMDALMHAVEGRQEMLVTLLEDTGISFERFLEVLRRAIIKGAQNPKTDLLRADAGSVIEACINACTDGLLPDGRQGAIVLYNVKLPKARRADPDSWGLRANWQPMYQGLLDIAYKSGNFQSIEARVVYDGDHFEYQLGDNPRIIHRPKLRPANTKAPMIVAAYAVAKTITGGTYREVFEGADIQKVNAVSKATNGPGKDWPEEMARKGPLRRMWKFLPKNDAMNRIIERDNEVLDLDLEDAPGEAAPAPERKLKAGFGAKPAMPALTQGADPTMPAMDGDMGGEFAPLEGEEASDAGEKRDMASGEGAGDRGGDRAPSSGPADAPKTDAPPPATDPVDSLGGDVAVEETTSPPELKAFLAQLSAASNWLGIKQALKNLAKTEYGADERVDMGAKATAWDRFRELHDAGKEKTDFISDPILFECWLLGSEADEDTIRANWEIVQLDKAYLRLGEDERGRISGRVGDALS